MKKFFTDWSKFEVSWLFISNIIMISTSILLGDTLIALISGVAGIISVVLCAKGRASNYIYGTINALLYGIICYQNHLYGGMMLNLLYYIPTNIIGFITWNKKKDETTGNVESRRLEKKGWMMIFAGLIVGTLGYSLILRALGGSFSILDAYITINTMVAVVLMISRYAEQWYLWLAGNIVNIMVWVLLIGQSAQAGTMLVMWAAYMVNSCYGLYNWIKLSKTTEEEIAEVA